MNETNMKRIDEMIGRALDIIEDGDPDDYRYKEAKYRLELLNDIRNKNIASEKEKDDRIFKYAKLGIEIAGVVLPLIFYSHWMKNGLKFEETGTFTSQTFKGLINRFKPTQK
jgi:hypothetical protein